MQLWYVFSEAPYTMALSQDYLDTRCSFCAGDANDQSKSRILCEQCEKVVYCGESCLQSDQSLHRSECQPIRQGKLAIASDATILGVRMLGRMVERYEQDKGVASLSFDFPSHLFEDRCLDDLMTHEKDMRGSSCHQQALNEVKTAFYEFFEDTPLSSTKTATVNQFFYRLAINGFSLNVRSKDNPMVIEELGEVMYLNASRFNHSCRPTCLYKFDGSRLIIEYIDEKRDAADDQHRALTKEEFENLTLQYGYGSYWNYGATCPLTNQRIKSLKTRYFFRCRCILCEDRKRDEMQLRSAPVECTQCKSPLLWYQPIPLAPVTLKKTCQCGDRVNAKNVKKSLLSGKATSSEVKKLCREWKTTMKSTTENAVPRYVVAWCTRLVDKAMLCWHPKFNLRLGQLCEKMFWAMCELSLDETRQTFFGDERDLNAILKIGEALLNVYTEYLEAYMVNIANYAQDVALLYKLRSQSVQDEERAAFWFQFAVSQWKARGETACVEVAEKQMVGPPMEWKPRDQE